MCRRGGTERLRSSTALRLRDRLAQRRARGLARRGARDRDRGRHAKEAPVTSCRVVALAWSMTALSAACPGCGAPMPQPLEDAGAGAEPAVDAQGLDGGVDGGFELDAGPPDTGPPDGDAD